MPASHPDMNHPRAIPLLLLLALVLACADPATVTTTTGQASAPTATDPTATDQGGSDIDPAEEPEGSRPDPDSPDARALADGLNRAGAQLFLAAAEDNTDDVVLSPFSIGVAFGMADVGASGQATAGLQELFGYPVDGQDRWSAFNTLLQQIAGDGEPVVTLANRQFPDLAFTPQPDFAEVIGTWFGATTQPLPLQQAPEDSREVINAYVAAQTRDLIPSLLPDGFITPRSVLVLVNALYLQADWQTPFGKYPTTDAPFTLLDGSTTTAALMDDKELFGPALDGDGFVAAAKPYEGEELDLLVVVPDEGRFMEVQARLGEGLLEEIAAESTVQGVELLLPRYSSDTQADLRALIDGSLGIEGIFSSDYPGIAAGIELTGAVHGADIATDEQGTVAAAATALGFQDSGPGEPDLVVRADRPFLYAIRHQPSGAVLFLGRVMDPEDPGPRSA